MSPEQFRQFLESNERATGEAIQKHVNGKIDAMKTDLAAHIIKHDAFMEEVRPILQTYQGGKVLGELVKWTAGVGLAVLAIKGFFK